MYKILSGQDDSFKVEKESAYSSVSVATPDTSVSMVVPKSTV